MNTLYLLNSLTWRRIPRTQRRWLLAKLEYYLPTRLFQKILGVAGSGIYRQEVLQTGVLFIHIPKAGGTSIVRELYGLDGVGHFPATEARALDPEKFDSLYRFTVTRNPWERLVSSYYFALSGGTPEVPLNNPGKYLPALPDTFSEFVLHWLVAQKPASVHSLFQPQTHFVCDSDGNLLVDDVFDLKDLQPLERVLTDKLARPVAFSRANTGMAPHPLASEYRNPEVVQAVSEYFATDIDLFGYQLPEELKHV